MHKLLILWIAGAAALLAGCNTLEGIGKDVKKGGQVIEDAAKKR